MASTTAADCAQALIHQWITSFGVTTHITSDSGPQLTHALWFHLCHQLNITDHPITAYHPHAYSLVKRLHRRLKAALHAQVATSAWYHHLPWILLSFRTTPAEESDGSLLQLPTHLTATGDSPTLELLASTGQQYFPLVPTHHNLAGPTPQPPTIPPALQTASHVLVRHPGLSQPIGPLFGGINLILEHSPLTFCLQIGTQSNVVAIDRLKPTVLPTCTSAAQPHCRGRPPILKPSLALPLALPTSTNHPSSPTGTSPTPHKRFTFVPGTSPVPPPCRGHPPILHPTLSTPCTTQMSHLCSSPTPSMLL